MTIGRIAKQITEKGLFYWTSSKPSEYLFGIRTSPISGPIALGSSTISLSHAAQEAYNILRDLAIERTVQEEVDRLIPRYINGELTAGQVQTKLSQFIEAMEV